MLPIYLLVAAAVLAATPAADAQDQVDQQNPNQVEQQSSPEPAPRVAIPRAEAQRSAIRAARLGMRSTAAMVARRGLALRLGERSVGHRDPGAVSCFILLLALAER